MARRPPQEFIQDITVRDDGIRPVRAAKLHSRDKLGILTSYLAAYGRACTRAGDFFFVDALSGPGLYHFSETDEWLLGSTLIALRSEPRFAKCVAIDLDPANVEALRRRTESDGRAIIVEGDCNQVLRVVLEQHIPTNRPSFVLLDPEGAELEWATVRSVAAFRQGPRKSELLILFPTDGMNRMLPVEVDIELHNEMRLNRLFPPDSGWRGIWEQRRANEITPADARDLYVQRYADGLTELGYTHVERREIRRTTGALVYHLVFATDHEAGRRIMSDVFGAMETNQPQLKLL